MKLIFPVNFKLNLAVNFLVYDVCFLSFTFKIWLNEKEIRFLIGIFNLILTNDFSKRTN